MYVLNAVNELELYNNNVTGFLDQIPYLIGANFVYCLQIPKLMSHINAC